MNPLSCPIWFRNLNIAFDLVFFLVTAAIAVTAWRAFLFMKRSQYRIHAIGFGLLSISYLALVLTNACLMSGIDASTIWMLIGYYAHALLFLAGIIVLLFTYLCIEQPSVRALLLILSLAVVAVFNRPSIDMQGFVFYVLTAVMIGFIVWRLITFHKAHHKRTTLLVLIGFVLLLVGQVLLALETWGKTFYVVAAVVILTAYVSIGASRLLVK